MQNKPTTLKIIHWIARILGGIAVVILVFSMFDEIIEFNDSSDVLSFVCFPILVILGLLVAYRHEGFGGLISIFGMIGLHILRNDLASVVEINLFAIPGILYLVYSGFMKRSY